MTKNKLLLLLALLMTAATGAWAEDIVISPASGANISTALATATDGKTVGNITINLAQNGAYTVSSAMEVPAGLTINGNGATINAESLTEGIGMFLGTGKDSPTRADIQISDLTIKSLGKSLYYSNGKKNYGDFIMNNCLVEVTSSVILFNYTKGSAVVNLTLTNSTFYAPTATTTQFYSSQAGQKLTEIIIDATQKFSFQNCTLYNMAKNKNFFSHRQNSQKWLSYEAKNSIFVNCGKSGEVVKGMNGGSAANDNPTWSIDGNLFNYDGADTSANETTGDTSEGEGVQNSVAGVVTFKDPSNGDFSGIITKSDNSTVDLTLGDPRWTAAAEPATFTVSLKDGVKDADKWTVKVGEGEAQALPIGGLKGDGSETVTLQYTGRLKVKSVKATSDAKPAPAGPPSWKLTLSSPAKDLYITANGGLIAQQTLDVASTEFTVEMPELTSQTVNIVATDGSGNCWYCTQENMSFAIGQTYQSSPTMNAVGTSSSAAVYKMTAAGPIPAGKTAVLSGVTFSSTISCSGDATIILMGNNTLNGGLQASPSGNTMTITGTGSLNARGSDYNPGIGAVDNNCGNIIICGGTITAQPDASDVEAAGIGSGEEGTCGNITICGGTVTATGGVNSAGIGSSYSACGTVTITDGATKVTATKGYGAGNSIGKGKGASCGTVTIDGVVNATTSSTFEHFNSDVSGNTWTLTHK